MTCPGCLITTNQPKWVWRGLVELSTISYGSTGMHRLKERGATGVFLETELAETPALRLFTSVGFRRVSAWQWMTKEIAPLA